MDHFKLNGELRCLSNLMRRKVDSDPVFAQQTKVTGMHGYVLGFICRRSKEGPVYQRDIEKAFNIRRSSATEMLNTMEQNGLILRECDEQDKRMKRLVLTKKAMDAHMTVVERLKYIDNEIMSQFSPEEQSDLIRLLSKLKAVLTEE